MDDESGRPAKDDSTELLVAPIWRPTLQAIVAAFVAGDWGLQAAPSNVKRVPATSALALQENLEASGDVTLAALPDDTWNSSVAMWTGTRWEVLVDLWTEQEGRSDLVLHAFVTEDGDDFVTEDGDDFVFEVDLIDVP